ncbi:hypothetical protein L211DRAFT_450406 [Terfezia boudieri ATCC MYA-4762]|uniref:Uncharacterized protein n=1 Tax=Terfezia boudieri ATCC MYA-4762 TaxID=1051890 RepID=A0A3N4LI74_9PEZI|nr:hypothetical protein L211DRAFT_450406 [Terfezia boudieri ATCC MYA-4762]
MAQRRPASSPAPEDPGSQKIRVFKTVPAIQTGSAGMSRQTAIGYSRKLVPALISHAAPEPDHECTHVLLGKDDLILHQEQAYLQECEQTYLEAKLRELGSTLHSKLLGVDHPNTINPWIDTRGLVPQQHFKLWLQNQTEKEQRIFAFTPPVHTAPVSPSGQARQPLQQITLINGVENVQTGSGQGQNASSWTQPEIFGTATRITIGQLADVLQSLSRATNAANVVVHKLTVRDVVNILTRNSSIENTLGKEPYEQIGALVVAILGRPLSKLDPTDLPKDFKNLVMEFKEKVKGATFLTKVDHEWKKAYEDELIGKRAEDLIKRGSVISITKAGSPNHYIQLET